MKSSREDIKQEIDKDECQRIIMACQNRILTADASESKLVSALESLKALLAAPAFEGTVDQSTKAAIRTSLVNCASLLKYEADLLRDITPSFSLPDMQHQNENNYLTAVTSLVKLMPKGTARTQYNSILNDEKLSDADKLMRIKSDAAIAAKRPSTPTMYGKTETVAMIQKAFSMMDTNVNFSDSRINMLEKRLSVEKHGPKLSSSK